MSHKRKREEEDDEEEEEYKPLISFSTEQRIEPTSFPLFPCFRDAMKKIASFLDHDSLFNLLATNKEMKKTLDEFFIRKNPFPRRYVISEIIKFKNEAKLEPDTVISPNDLLEVTMAEMYQNIKTEMENLLPYRRIRNIRVYGDSKFRAHKDYYLERTVLIKISHAFPYLETLELVHLSYFLQVNQQMFPKLQYLRIFAFSVNPCVITSVFLNRDITEMCIYSNNGGKAEILSIGDAISCKIGYLHGNTEIETEQKGKGIVPLITLVDKRVVKKS